MFFVGIFGIQDKTKEIHTEQNIVCPICDSFDSYQVLQTYTYFHFFFIPLWRWNYRYFLKTRCCNRVCQLEQEVGTRIEQGEQVVVQDSDLSCSGNSGLSTCPQCGGKQEAGYNYCPQCGSSLKDWP